MENKHGYKYVLEDEDTRPDDDYDKEQLKRGIEVEKEHTLNALEIECRQNHLVRMRDGICEDNIAASIIIDIISSIERIGDIALNTANSTITVYKDHKVKYLNV